MNYSWKRRLERLHVDEYNLVVRGKIISLTSLAVVKPRVIIRRAVKVIGIITQKLFNEVILFNIKNSTKIFPNYKVLKKVSFH